MKQRLLTFISALFILFLTSNCASIKPFFKVENVQSITPHLPTYMTQVNRATDNHSYVPTSAEENGLLNLNKSKYKFSASLPAKVKFEF